MFLLVTEWAFPNMLIFYYNFLEKAFFLRLYSLGFDGQNIYFFCKLHKYKVIPSLIYVLFLAAIASRFQITKYPTIKVLINGQPAKREYRGKRSVEAFVSFVQKQLEDPIQEVANMFVSTDSVDVS